VSTRHISILGYLVPYDGVKDLTSIRALCRHRKLTSYSSVQFSSVILEWPKW